MFDPQRTVALTAINALADAAEAQVAALNNQLASDEQKIAALTAQIARLQGTGIDALEYGPWSMNAGAGIGGSGQGTATWKSPGVECAELSIAPVAGNYYDNMFSQHIAAIPSKTYLYEEKFLFPSIDDAFASQALETDFKHQVGTLRFQFASQLDFSDKQVRFWTPATKWTSFPVPWALGRFAPLVWHKLVLEAHRDDTTMYLDALTLDGTREPIGISWLAPVSNWTEGITWGIQLDGNGAGEPYRVKIDDVRLTMQP